MDIIKKIEQEQLKEDIVNPNVGDQPPFPRPPGRRIGSFRGLPQKAIS